MRNRSDAMLIDDGCVVRIVDIEVDPDEVIVERGNKLAWVDGLLHLLAGTTPSS